MKRLAARRRGGQPLRIVASGLGEDMHGGVYVLEDGGFALIDRRSTTGLAVSSDGTQLARLVWADPKLDPPGEVLIYDHRGVRRHHRVDELREPHSAYWDRDLVVAVSTGRNAILWLDHEGEIVRRWAAPGEGDCWHLNSLSLRRGRLLVSAFGRFKRAGEWADASARRGQGIVIDVRSRRNALAGLSAPHNPLWLDRGWLVCNSADGELLRLNRKGAVVNRRQFSGWTRGLAYDPSRVYVGVSAHRYRGNHGSTAFVMALTRDGLQETAAWPLPCREVYDVVLVPQPLVDGLRAGAGHSYNRPGARGRRVSVEERAAPDASSDRPA